MNKAQEENREDEQALPPVETEEEETPADPNEETPAPSDTEQDIDFDQELAALESETIDPDATPAPAPSPAPGGKTEEEKAGYTIKQSINRLKKQGKSDAEISKIVGFTVVTEDPEDEETPAAPQGSGFVTKEDLRILEAEKEARQLATHGEKEVKVIMWYVKHRNLSVSDAHLLANKGRIKRNSEEIARAGQSRPAAPVPAGHKPTPASSEKFTRTEMDMFTRRGFTWNPKTKRMEGKHVFVALAKDPTTGERVTGKMPRA